MFHRLIKKTSTNNFTLFYYFVKNFAMENKKLSQPRLATRKKYPLRIKYRKFSWSNSDNILTYQKIPLNIFKKTAIAGGLDNGCDVKALKKYIQNAKSILEVGAGYGRVLDHIIKSGFKGKLYALERTTKFCRFLNKHFPTVKIIHADVRKFKTKHKFDLILLMWAGLGDFSHDEQLLILKNLKLHLGHHGFLIFDLIPIGSKVINAINYDRQNKSIFTAYGDHYGYFPLFDEIEFYTRKLNLSLRERKIYKTKTNKIRYLYILEKLSYITDTNATSQKRTSSRK